MDVRAVPRHRSAGGPCRTDPDARADALVAALAANALGVGPQGSVSADVAARARCSWAVPRNAAYPPECVVTALKDALRRAHHGRRRARATAVGAADRYEFDFISLGVRRMFGTRKAAPPCSRAQR